MRVNQEEKRLQVDEKRKEYIRILNENLHVIELPKKTAPTEDFDSEDVTTDDCSIEEDSEMKYYEPESSSGFTFKHQPIAISSTAGKIDYTALHVDKIGSSILPIGRIETLSALSAIEDVSSQLKQ